MKDKQKGIAPLIPFLALVAVIFIGILIFAYVQTRNLNPQMIEVVGANQAPAVSEVV